MRESLRPDFDVLLPDTSDYGSECGFVTGVHTRKHLVDHLGTDTNSSERPLSEPHRIEHLLKKPLIFCHSRVAEEGREFVVVVGYVGAYEY